MIRTQIQLPDELYKQAKKVAADREWSLAELCRRGLEYMLNVCPPPEQEWELPEPLALGDTDPFSDPEWREQIHLPERGKKVAEDRVPWGEGDGES